MKGNSNFVKTKKGGGNEKVGVHLYKNYQKDTQQNISNGWF